jgi:integrase
MPLNDKKIQTLRPASTGRPTRHADEKGLYLEVASGGGKWWRLKYRFEGKEKRLSLGVYPDVSLKSARARRDEARKLLASGVDPGVHRKAQKAAGADRAANTFEMVAREWMLKRASDWVDGHKIRIQRLFERDLFPRLGDRPIAEIAAPELLGVLRRIEERAAETATRALSNCGQVFRYAVATGRCASDPSASLRGALAAPISGHFAATLEPMRLGAILRAFDEYGGTAPVRCALRLVPLVFVRPGELRRAEWSHIDFEAGEWRYFITKTKTEHIVPLSDQAKALLLDLAPVTGKGKYVFPSARSAKRPMSDNAVLAAMRRMDIGAEEMSGHGFRAVARTILDEVLGYRPDIIEHQLAHAVKDPNGRAYNRTAHLTERHRMMQGWGNHLDFLKAGKDDVLPFKTSA